MLLILIGPMVTTDCQRSGAGSGLIDHELEENGAVRAGIDQKEEIFNNKHDSKKIKNGMFDLVTGSISKTEGSKTQDETRQGEAYAPFAGDPNLYKKRFYIESYGCQMNFADSEIVASILNQEGFGATRNLEEADLIFINTCSIREKAEQTVRKRLTEFRKLKEKKRGMLIGVLGCMAERLKAKFLEEEKLVDMVVGPDAYRTLPGLVEEAGTGQKAINVLLSRDETYADISPVRLDSNGVSAFVSIMRGCNNMCAFCVVPFTRGRERSRDTASIVAECRDLFEKGYREVTLLGQNVDSYYYNNESAGEQITFGKLLEQVALISPLLRVRFSTSHPKDITDEVLYTMAKYENICRYVHLPVQSGSTRMLQLMNRTYTREWYMAKVDRIREIMPDCGISSDVIAGFCTEEETDHQDTLDIMEYSRYDLSYMYFYSERPGTLAQRRYKDDVPEDVKKRRLQEIVDMQYKLSLESNQRDLGKTYKVLIEGTSKRSDADWMARNSQNKVIIFPKEAYDLKPGDYAMVNVTECSKATLLGKIVETI
ncbi:tRNA (N6-isopentenyl adenosine(37)-C2)-methylthiotransferase MiaB [Terrimonas ginsenosidimutans]|nr:tRNA (N6-isopentenyl adenosine(37)-C2)-methylthiotransferase MiaB [Terrimonas ginsenosidimutans]